MVAEQARRGSSQDIHVKSGDELDSRDLLPVQAFVVGEEQVAAMRARAGQVQRVGRGHLGQARAVAPAHFGKEMNDRPRDREDGNQVAVEEALDLLARFKVLVACRQYEDFADGDDTGKYPVAP